jgi:tRNA1Val (adenine37-N6)-methyltransferase
MKLRSQLKGEDETLDSFYRGSILVLQKKEGYRFSIDAPLLADFIQTKRSDEILELGAGNGIISLLLSIKPFRHITAVEIQESLADMARRNVKLNNLERKISIIREDLRHYHPGKKFDVIFSNPPYIKKGEGHLSSSLEKSIAKHELKCDIFGILEKTAKLLKSKGRAYFVYLAKRKDDLFKAIERNSLKIKSIRFVYPRQDNPPNLLLAECDFSSEKEALLAPFILYDKGGGYTPEAEEIFRGRIDAKVD